MTIGGETIPVKPVIGDLDEGEAFVVGEGSVTVTVKAIPGLKYELVRWETVSAVSSKPPYTVVASEIATGMTVTLEDAESPEGKAFYRVVATSGVTAESGIER